MSEPSWSTLKPLRPDDKPSLILQELTPSDNRETGDAIQPDTDRKEPENDWLRAEFPTEDPQSDPRITNKTVRFFATLIVLFLFGILWFFAPSHFHRQARNDLERDNLSGPVQCVIYSRASFDPLFDQWADASLRFELDYNPEGNRILEKYFNPDNSISYSVVFGYNQAGKRVSTEVLEGGVKPTSETVNIQYGLFNPLNTETLLTHPDIYRAYFEDKTDSYGNWTSRDYFVRRSSKLYEHKPIGTEYRKILYLNANSSSTMKPTLAFPTRQPTLQNTLEPEKKGS